MDVAYPLREKRLTLDPLTWSLRSLTNLPSVDRVFLIGARPAWTTNIEHIPTLQGPRKFVNIGVNLLALLDIPDLSDPFIWFNDDMFVTKPWEPVVTTRLRTMDDFTDSLQLMGNTDHDDYVYGMRSQREIMRAWGHDTSTMRCPDNHWPIPVSPERCRHILARVAVEFPDHELGHFKAIYAAGLDLYETRDCKAQNTQLPPPDLLALPVLSVSNLSWKGKAGQMIRHQFDEPSPYET